MSFSCAATTHSSPLSSLWVLPSLVYGVCQWLIIVACCNSSCKCRVFISLLQ
jgi:hypothetical protein